MQPFIWCDNCDAIKPVKEAPMLGADVNGEFADPVDILCGECRLVIATTYGSHIPQPCGEGKP